MSTKLVKYDALLSALAAIERVDEAKDVRDKADALLIYAKRAKDPTAISRIIDIKFTAIDKGGELLTAMAKSGERAVKGQPRKEKSQTATLLPKLTDLGVNKTLSSRWQRFHLLPKTAKSDAVARAKKKALLAVHGATGRTREEMRKEDADRVRKLTKGSGRYPTLVIDPPWDHEGLSLAGRGMPTYAVMSHEELLALDVEQWATDDCAMYLWITNNFVPRGVELMECWGFQHKTMLTWVKPRFGLGSYFRSSTEHVLFGVKGQMRTRRDDIPTHFEAPLGKHSEKPEEFYDIVRAASHPPYGEVFQIKQRADFVGLFKATVKEAAE